MVALKRMQQLNRDNYYSSAFAGIYDDLMRNVPYKSWVQYVRDSCLKFQKRNNSLLDLACGTGSFLKEYSLLFNNNQNLAGIDGSSSMIEFARKKLPENISLHCKDIRDYNLDLKFDVITILFDSINYLTSESDVIQTLKNCRSHLKRDGILIFDSITSFGFRAGIVEDCGSFKNKRNDFKYTITGNYIEEQNICIEQFEFLGINYSSASDNFNDVYYQKPFEPDKIEYMLLNSGFNVLDIFSSFSFKPYSSQDERVVCITEPNNSLN